MRRNELDYILTTLLDSHKDVSDILFTVDRPLQVEVSGQLLPVPIQPAVEKLSPNQRQVIELAYFEGLSQTEMAERMGQPLGTVKTWVRAALKNLRDELGAVVSA